MDSDNLRLQTALCINVIAIDPLMVATSGLSQNFGHDILSGLYPHKYLTERLKIFIRILGLQCTSEQS